MNRAAEPFAHPLLRVPTPAAWVERACESPDVLLMDHANCEKKAASTALSLMFAYAEDLDLTDKMSRLAREELRHYEQGRQADPEFGADAATSLHPAVMRSACAGWWRRASRAAKSI